MNTASRSKMSTSGSVTSPWTSSGMPIAAIALQHRHDPVDIGDAVRRVGRGVRRVELDRREHALLVAARDLGRIGAVGQVAGHQRRELRPGRQRREDALAIRRAPPRPSSPAAPGSASRSRGRTAARVHGTTCRSIAPSRRCTCQSSGRRRVIVFGTVTPASVISGRPRIAPAPAGTSPRESARRYSRFGEAGPGPPRRVPGNRRGRRLPDAIASGSSSAARRANSGLRLGFSRSSLAISTRAPRINSFQPRRGSREGECSSLIRCRRMRLSWLDRACRTDLPKSSTSSAKCSQSRAWFVLRRAAARNAAACVLVQAMKSSS